MTRRRFSVGEAAVTQGDPGDFFFVVESGAFRVEVDGQAVDSVGPSGCFGELALVYNNPREATVTAVTDCVCQRLSRNDAATFHEELERSAAVAVPAASYPARPFPPG